MVWEKIFVALDFFFPSTVMSFQILVVLQIGYFYFPQVTFLGNTFVWISYVLSDPCHLIHSIRLIFSAIITNVMQPQTRDPSLVHFQTCSFWIYFQIFYSQRQRKKINKRKRLAFSQTKPTLSNSKYLKRKTLKAPKVE